MGTFHRTLFGGESGEKQLSLREFLVKIPLPLSLHGGEQGLYKPWVASRGFLDEYTSLAKDEVLANVERNSRWLLDRAYSWTMGRNSS